MKKLLTVACVIFLSAGCGVNENKGTRIQNLEDQQIEITSQLNELESRVQALESQRTDK